MIGIYQLRNTRNGKRYIGQSKNISHRKSCHFYDLKNNRHRCKDLQVAYNENPESIVFEVICKCGVEELDDLERFFIEKYDTVKAGYNLASGGITGARHSPESIQLMSERKMGNKCMCGIRLSDEWKKHLSLSQPHKKRIECVETGILYESFADAARKTGLNRTKIVSVCTGKRKTTGGFHFRYAD